VAPADALQDIRSEIILRLINANVPVEVHHHEVATAGQCEIDLHYGPLVTMADSLMMYKYVIKNVARSYGKTATFMPKPLFQDNGSGMHVHQSLWKDGTNLFADLNGYAGLSERPSIMLAGCSRTRRHCSRCAPRRQIPIGVWCQDMRHPSISSTPSETAARLSASRCTRLTPKPSGSNFGRRIPPPTRILPLRRC